MPKHLLRNNHYCCKHGGLPIQYIIQTQNFSKLEEKIPVFMEEVDNDPTFQCLM
jgi:hypothetical protein